MYRRFIGGIMASFSFGYLAGYTMGGWGISLASVFGIGAGLMIFQEYD